MTSARRARVSNERRESDLRVREVRAIERAAWGQVLTSILAATATAFAAYAAFIASDAVKAQREGISRQAEEQRLGIAVEAIGGDNFGERVAGITLLARQVTDSITQPDEESTSTDSERRSLYDAAVMIIVNFLKGEVGSSVVKKSKADWGSGWGNPKIPADVVYAAGELKRLLKLKKEVLRLSSKPLGVDLSNLILWGQYWMGIDFSWVVVYAVGVDLRNADLSKSRWGTSATLANAYLECAHFEGASLEKVNLSNAHLHWAKLNGANLEGSVIDEADISGADFTGANLRGVDLSKARNVDKARGLESAKNVDWSGVDRSRASFVARDKCS